MMKTLLKKIQKEIYQNPMNLIYGYGTDEEDKFLGMQQLRSGSVIGGPEFKRALTGKSKRENLAQIGSLIEQANQRDIGI